MVFIIETVMAQFLNFVQIKPINALLYIPLSFVHPLPPPFPSLLHLATYIYQISTRKVPQVAHDVQGSVSYDGCIFFFLYPPTDISTHPLSKENDLR